MQHLAGIGLSVSMHSIYRRVNGSSACRWVRACGVRHIVGPLGSIGAAGSPYPVRTRTDGAIVTV